MIIEHDLDKRPSTDERLDVEDAKLSLNIPPVGLQLLILNLSPVKRIEVSAQRAYILIVQPVLLFKVGKADVVEALVIFFLFPLYRIVVLDVCTNLRLLCCFDLASCFLPSRQSTSRQAYDHSCTNSKSCKMLLHLFIFLNNNMNGLNSGIRQNHQLQPMCLHRGSHAMRYTTKPMSSATASTNSPHPTVGIAYQVLMVVVANIHTPIGTSPVR